MAKKKNNTALIATISILMLLLGMFVLFALNNFSTEQVYKVISCTFNKHDCECDCPDWDGTCTQEIEDKCCMDIRWCGGTVNYEYECLDKYCEDEGYTCGAVPVLQGIECKCLKVI